MQRTDTVRAIPCTRIAESPLHGRGVFAARAIRRGECVLENEVLPVELDEIVPGGVLSRYCYEWPFDGDGRAFALGEASLLNHAPKSDEDARPGVNGRHLRANLVWETDVDALQIRFYATRDIKEGEEFLIDYGEDYAWESA